MSGSTFYFDWEVSYLVFLQNLFGEIGAKFATLITHFSEPAFVLLLFFVIYYAFDKELGKKLGLMITSAIIGSCLLKNVLLRRRPYFDHPEVKCLKNVSDGDLYDIRTQGYSFPSGHSMNAAALYGTLANHTVRKWLKVVCCALIFLVGLSRNILGVHYPTDVLVGWIAAFGIVFLIELSLKKLGKKKTYLIVVVIASLGLLYCSTNDYFTTLGGMYGFMLGDLFEEKYVKFDNTKKVKEVIGRLLGAAVTVGLVYVISKAVIPSVQDSEAHRLVLLWNTLRYGIMLFVAVGPYTWLFQYVETKLAKK